MNKLKALSVLVAVAALAGCRPSPEEPLVYRNADDFTNPEGPGGGEPIEGPDPYEPGEARLALGIFYEGEFSEQVIIDDMLTNFFIFEGTFSMVLDSNVVAEGLESNRITHAGLTFLGGGINWMDSRGLSAWTTLYVSLNSSDASFSDLEIVVQVESGEAGVDASDYGFVNDGAWHHLAIPVADFEGIELTQVTGPFVFLGGTGDLGERLWIDNVYYTQD